MVFPFWLFGLTWVASLRYGPWMEGPFLNTRSGQERAELRDAEESHEGPHEPAAYLHGRYAAEGLLKNDRTRPFHVDTIMYIYRGHPN